MRKIRKIKIRKIKIRIKIRKIKIRIKIRG
jgi:hypothetical protein